MVEKLELATSTYVNIIMNSNMHWFSRKQLFSQTFASSHAHATVHVATCIHLYSHTSGTKASHKWEINASQTEVFNLDTSQMWSVAFSKKKIYSKVQLLPLIPTCFFLGHWTDLSERIAREIALFYYCRKFLCAIVNYTIFQHIHEVTAYSMSGVRNLDK